MTSKRPKLPGLSSAIETYVDVIEKGLADKSRFTVEDLHNKLLADTNSPEDVASERALYGHLHQLSKVGLLYFYGDNTFSLRIGPDDEEEERREKAADHMEKIWSEVEGEIERLTENGSSPDTVRRDGGEYVLAYVGAKTDLEKMQKYAWQAVDHKEHAGLALQTGPQHVDQANSLSDQLTDEEKMTGSPCAYRFEVGDRDLEEAESGGKVYRVYLDEIRFTEGVST